MFNDDHISFENQMALIDLSDNLTSEYQAESNCLADEPTEKSLKTFKTLFLTYLRQNYLRIISILMVLIFFLFLLVSLLSIIIAKGVPLNKTVIIENHVINYSDTEVEEFSKLSCRPIKCYKGCNITDTSYAEIKYLSCCLCFEEDYVLKEYQRRLSTNSVTLLFQDKYHDPKLFSDRDVDAMPQLKNLGGNWDVVQTNDTSYWFSYGNVFLKDQHH